MKYKIDKETESRIPPEFRFTGVRDDLPDRCDCVKFGLSMNSHRMIRVRNERGLIKFCPVTRHGYIQLNGTGTILDGVFRGNMEGD